MESILVEASLRVQIITLNFGPRFFKQRGPKDFVVENTLTEYQLVVGRLEEHSIIDCDYPWLAADVESNGDGLDRVQELCQEDVVDECRVLGERIQSGHEVLSVRATLHHLGITDICILAKNVCVLVNIAQLVNLVRSVLDLGLVVFVALRLIVVVPPNHVLSVELSIFILLIEANQFGHIHRTCL